MGFEHAGHQGGGGVSRSGGGGGAEGGAVEGLSRSTGGPRAEAEVAGVASASLRACPLGA